MMEITQEDRELAWRVRPVGYSHVSRDDWLSGEYDNCGATPWIAAHRIASEQAVLTKLRDLPDDVVRGVLDHLPDYEGGRSVHYYRCFAAALADAIGSKAP